MGLNKQTAGRFFEDFALGEEIIHPIPRTVTEGDVALYTALTGARFALNSADSFARALGYPRAPIDDILLFHIVFGKTVPDISLNAVANLGYAAGRFCWPVYPGDTLRASSRVIGLKQNSDGKTGIVYVQSTGRNQDDETVLDYVRWVMVRKRDPESPAPETVLPDLPKAVAREDLVLPERINREGFDSQVTGSGALWEDYSVGERLDHRDGMTIEEAEHMMATRLYHNTARVHFNQHSEGQGRFGRRIIYGGHIVSLARALSVNGLANALAVLAINGGRHVAPTFAGDTIYAWSEVLDKFELPQRPSLGALRLRTVAVKDCVPSEADGGFPYKDREGKYHPAVVLDLDYTVLVPR